MTAAVQWYKTGIAKQTFKILSFWASSEQYNKLCQVCYFHLRRLRTVRRSLTKESLLTLVHAFITSRVDHCNGVLYGSNGYLLDRLQSVLNSAARLILGVPKFVSVSAAIRNELHWLSIRKRIQFKIALLVRHCIVGAAPEYLTELCRWVHPLVGRVYALPRVVISLLRDSDFEDLATGLLLSLGPTCGTLFRPKLDNRVTIFYSSRVNWKHFCSSSPEPFCGSISNEGPYKYSILLLLLLLLLIHNSICVDLFSQFVLQFSCNKRLKRL